MKNIFLALLFSTCSTVFWACDSNNANQTTTQKDAHDHAHDENHDHNHEGHRVFFISPTQGTTLKSPIQISMGIDGMEVEPAGAINEGKGHHHLIINGSYIEKGKVIPFDEQHIHFGKGQTDTLLALAPGKYSLTLQFADGAHQSYGQPLSETIEITVE